MTRSLPPVGEFGARQFERPSAEMTTSRRGALLALGGLGVATLVAAHATPAAATTNAPDPVTGWFHVTDFGADPGGGSDAGPAINAAIAAAKATTHGSGVVYMPPGTYRIDTTIDMSNIHPNYKLDKQGVVRLMGAGRYQTRLVGGEPGYGFIEMVGSNRCTVEGFSIIQTTPMVKTGILLGRTGNATLAPSSQEHYLKDIIIVGEFDVAGIFALASEITAYDDILVYTYAGRGIVLARDIQHWTAVEFPSFAAKYTPLCTWQAMPSGNGLIRMNGIQILTNHDDAQAAALTWEYGRASTCDRLYTWTRQQPHIVLSKSNPDVSFRGLDQEWDHATSTDPIGFYLRGVNANRPSWEVPQFRFSVDGSRILPIYGDDDASLGDFTFRASEWTGFNTEYQVDVSYAYGLDIHYDPRVRSTDGVPGRPKYRARTGGARIQMWPNDFPAISRPHPNEVGEGCQIYDTTLNKPLWSRNGMWLDSSGTPS